MLVCDATDLESILTEFYRAAKCAHCSMYLRHKYSLVVACLPGVLPSSPSTAYSFILLLAI